MSEVTEKLAEFVVFAVLATLMMGIVFWVFMQLLGVRS